MVKTIWRIGAVILASAALLAFVSGTSFAAVTGKIAGKITDEETGEALPGVSILIEGTTMGASTDLKGRYFILDVPLGTYSLKAVMIGYVPKRVIEVRVGLETTTEIDFKLKSTVIAVAEPIVVVAARPLIDKMLTASRTVVSAEQLDNTLPVAGINDIVETSASVFKGYIRGGRKYESKLLLDGVDITDTYFSAGTGRYGEEAGHAYQAFRRSDTREVGSVSVTSSSLAELNVLAGTFNAEYPTATAGVVNVVTREGGRDWHGKIFIRSTATDGLEHMGTNIYRDAKRDAIKVGDVIDRDIDGYFDEKAAWEAKGDPESLRRAELFTWTKQKCRDKYLYDPDEGRGLGYSYEVEGNLHGPLTRKGGLFLTGSYSDRKGPLPFDATRLLTLSSKLHYQVRENQKLTGYFQLEDGGDLFGWVNTKFNPKFKYYMEGSPRYKSSGLVGYLKWTQTLSPKTFYEVQVSQSNKKNLMGFPDDNGDGWCDIDETGDFIDFGAFDKKYQPMPTNIDSLRQLPESEWSKYISPDYIKYVGWDENGYTDDTYTEKVFLYPRLDPAAGAKNKMLFSGYEGYYRNAYPSPLYERLIRNATTLKGDITSQVSYNHQLKAGAQFRYHTVDENMLQTPVGGAGNEYPYSKFWVNDFDFHPMDISFYAQDRIEYSGLIMNVGARVDGFKSGAAGFENDFAPFEEVTDPTIGFLRFEPLRGDKEPWKFYVNPRVGISHPVTDRMAIHYSWGKFSQYPNFASLYEDYNFTDYAASPNLNAPLIGQDPTITTAYEMGIQTAFAHPTVGEFVLDVTAYYRDIENYTRRNFVLSTRTGRGINIWTTWGYADARGIEATLERRPGSKYVSGRLTYAYSYIKSSVPVGGKAEDQRLGYDTKKDSTKFGGELPWEILDAYNSYERHVVGQAGNAPSGGYDRPQRITASLLFDFPFGIKFSTVTTASSGFYYRLAEEDPTGRYQNLATSCWNVTSNLRAGWELTDLLKLGGGVRATLFYEVRNLLNRENITAYAYRGFTGALDHAVWEQAENPEGHVALPTDDYGNLFYDIAREQYIGLEISF